MGVLADAGGLSREPVGQLPAGDGGVAAAAQRTLDQVFLRPGGQDRRAERTRAVPLHIPPSLDLLPAWGAERLTELGIFASKTVVPASVVARLWDAGHRRPPGDV